MSMARKESPGLYYVGIYEVERRGKRWHATAFGPGTIGDGKAGDFPTLAAAYLALTGEPLRATPGASRQDRKQAMKQAAIIAAWAVHGVTIEQEPDGFWRWSDDAGNSPAFQTFAACVRDVESSCGPLQEQHAA